MRLLPGSGSARSGPRKRDALLDRPLPLEQGVELVVIKELLGHAHIGVTATVYAHVRLRLQRDTLGSTLDGPTSTKAERNDGDEPPPCAAGVR
ncbi:hypothetical protein ABT121_12350 [Streptomyces sp. NPDC001928]|uniref:hypothetical protein n=1 Tax=Streptomyces sp. NPDC001928 TaxID=3154404 RepID=UPI00332A23B3